MVNCLAMVPAIVINKAVVVFVENFVAYCDA
jgi:hypothetical protein